MGSLLIAALAALLMADQRCEGAELAWLPGGRVPPGALLAAACAVVILPLLSWELSSLLRAIHGAAPGFASTAAMSISAFIMGVAWAYGWDAVKTAAAAALLMTLLPALHALLRRDWIEALDGLGYWLLTSLWIGWLPACWIAARTEMPAWALAWAVLTVKAGDIGAYFTGRMLGRHRLAPWVSPKKSREGLLGGAVLAALVGAWLAWQLGRPVALGAAFGALAAFIGMLGDLAESVLKREAGAKDSGRLLPGMGGCFDVIDSLLPTAPLALVMLAASH